MIDVLALKYSCLDTNIFNERAYFQELLCAAMERELISLKEGVELSNAMYIELSKEYEKWLQEHRYDCVKYISREKYIDYHMYMVSVYFSNFRKPSEALRLIIDTPAHEIHENAIKYFESKVNSIYVKLHRNEIAIRRVSNMVNYYDILKKEIGAIYDVENKDKVFVDTVCGAEYKPMNTCDLNYKSIVSYYDKYVDAFVLEAKIMSKFGEQIRELFGNEYRGNLADVIYEFIYKLLRMRNPKLSQNVNGYEKKQLITNQCQEYVFYLLFNCEDIIKFSEDEKVYLRKYLFQRLKRDLFDENVKSCF